MVLPQSKLIQDFDTSSFLISVDSHDTQCVSNDIKQSSTPIIPSRQVLCKEFGDSTTPITGEGTIKLE